MPSIRATTKNNETDLKDDADGRKKHHIILILCLYLTQLHIFVWITKTALFMIFINQMLETRRCVIMINETD